MKTGAGYFAAIALTLVAICSCNQDPIFFTISRETAPLEPLIKGSPTNMVRFIHNGVDGFFVASKQLYRYTGGSWNYSGPQPSGRVIALAATANYLYAVCITGDMDRTLRRLKNDGTNWETIPFDAGGSPMIQSIYADPDPVSKRLFVGTGNTDPFAIWHIHDDDGDAKLKLLINETKYLSGAAFDGSNYYLSTRDIVGKGGGIFMVDFGGGPDIELLESPGGENKNLQIIGMIKLEDGTIIAVERDGGAFFEVGTGGIERRGIATGGWATGALAIWEHPHDVEKPKNETRKLLVAGIQGGLYNTTTSSYTHGYVEFDLESSDGSLIGSRRDPGILDTIYGDHDQDRYKATIGKHPINHLFQVPGDIDSNMTFFASTKNVGLWSYRERPRDGGWQWNAEN